MPYNVFVSYSRKNTTDVVAVVERLKALGISVFFDTEGIEAADVWRETITSAIVECKVFVLMCSQEAFRSGNVRKELSVATIHTKPLVPFFIEPAQMTGTFLYEFSSIQHLHYYENPDAAMDSLCRLIEKHCPPSVESSASASPLPVVLQKTDGPERAAEIERYKKFARKFWADDGILDADERKYLNEIAETIGLTDAEIAGLLEAARLEIVAVKSADPPSGVGAADARGDDKEVRSAAARKAWETRRLKGNALPEVSSSSGDPAADAAAIDDPGDQEAKDTRLAVRVGSEILSGSSAAAFYVEVWRYLFTKGHVKPADLPIQDGRTRFVVSTGHVHPNGREFFSAKEVVPGVFLETHASRSQIMHQAEKFLSRYGISFDVIAGVSDRAPLPADVPQKADGDGADANLVGDPQVAPPTTEQFVPRMTGLPCVWEIPRNDAVDESDTQRLKELKTLRRRRLRVAEELKGEIEHTYRKSLKEIASADSYQNYQEVGIEYEAGVLSSWVSLDLHICDGRIGKGGMKDPFVVVGFRVHFLFNDNLIACVVTGIAERQSGNTTPDVRMRKFDLWREHFAASFPQARTHEDWYERYSERLLEQQSLLSSRVAGDQDDDDDEHRLSDDDDLGQDPLVVKLLRCLYARHGMDYDVVSRLLGDAEPVATLLVEPLPGTLSQEQRSEIFKSRVMDILGRLLPLAVEYHKTLNV